MRTQFTHALHPYPVWYERIARSGKGLLPIGKHHLKFSTLLAFVFFALSFLSTLSVKAQYNCTSNDVRIVNALLSTTTGGEIACTGDDPTASTLHLIVSTKTPRKGVYISAELWINGAYNTTLANCYDNDLSGTNNDLTADVNIPCPVGKTIELRNVFVAWGTGSSQFCPSTTPATPSKCRFKEGEVIVVELLGSGFTFEQSACTNNSRTVTFTGHASGGTPNYNYDWYVDYGLATENHFASTSNSSSATNTASYDFVSDADYNVTLVVTDAANTVKTTTHLVPVTACCVPSEDPTSISATLSTVCSGNSTTLSVVGGSLGTNADWKWYTGGCGTANGGTLVHTGSSYMVSPTSTTTYYVRAEGDCGTTECVSKEITVKTAPSVTDNPDDATKCVGESVTFSATFDGTSPTYQWYKGDVGSGSPIDGATSASLTINPVALTDAGKYYVVATNSCNSASSTAATLTVNSLVSITGNPSGDSKCAGGSTSFSVSATGTGLSYQWYKGAVGSGSLVSNQAGHITGATTSTLTINPLVVGDAGSYYCVVTGTCNAQSSTAATLVVTPNTICAGYSGDYFKTTGSTSTGGSATVTLKFNISNGPTLTCNSAGGLTASSFLVTSDAAGQVSYGAYTYSGGVLTVPATITIPNNDYSITVKFTLAVPGGNYIFSSECTENPLVTVSSLADGFVTGGGYIIPTNSGGTIGTPALGYRNNFGFNIKSNKSGNKYQGNWNTIIRVKGPNSTTQLYQVKSSQPASLTIGKISATSYRADFVFNNANIQNLTIGQGYGATSTVYVTVFDNGEPGSGTDQVYIKVVYPGTTNWYLSTTTPNGIPVLNNGNIQIHTMGRSGATTTKEIQDITTLQRVELKASPNPTRSYFTLQFSSSIQCAAKYKVTDILGRIVESRTNLLPGQTVKVGDGYKPGVYILEVRQGDTIRQMKLVKQ